VVIIATASALAPSLGIAAVPLGFAIGMAVKVLLLSLALVPRLRAIPKLPAEDLAEDG
jgi:uncharacterized membrane protein (Fun14 family)